MSGRVVQGWHSDPFGVHEARYFSAAGQPTKLVRDMGVESYDEPPSGADEVATTDSTPLDMTMDFAYTAAPLHVTAPPAASTISLNAYLNQL